MGKEQHASVSVSTTASWRHTVQGTQLGACVCLAQDPAHYLLGLPVREWCRHWLATPCAGQQAHRWDPRVSGEGLGQQCLLGNLDEHSPTCYTRGCL